MNRVYIALQELETVALMLHRISFDLSHKKVSILLDSSAVEAYLCNQSGTISLSLSRLACCVLDVANKHDMTVILAYIPTHLYMEAVYLSGGRLVPKWHLLHIAEAVFQLQG